MAASYSTSITSLHPPDRDQGRNVPVHLSLDEIEHLVGIVERAWRGARRDQLGQSRGAEQPEKLAAVARFLIWSRQRRNAMLSEIDFGEPAWDMILDLYVSSIEKRRVSVSSLCVAAGVPSSTALRWINSMVDAGHFIRQQDGEDARRRYIDLSPDMNRTVETYLIELRRRILDAVL